MWHCCWRFVVIFAHFANAAPTGRQRFAQTRRSTSVSLVPHEEHKRDACYVVEYAFAQTSVLCYEKPVLYNKEAKPSGLCRGRNILVR